MANTYLTAVTGSPLKGTIKSIALALANRANDNGTCWPSVNTLASGSGFSSGTVKRAIAYLKEHHYLTVEARSRKDGSQTSNRYTLSLQAFTTGVKQAAKAVKKGFDKAVEMGKAFIADKVQTIKPTSSRIGEQALLALPDTDQTLILERLRSKTNPVLKSHLQTYGLDSSYVQTALFNEVQQLQRERQNNHRAAKTTVDRLTDCRWAEGL